MTKADEAALVDNHNRLNDQYWVTLDEARTLKLRLLDEQALTARLHALLQQKTEDLQALTDLLDRVDSQANAFAFEMGRKGVECFWCNVPLGNDVESIKKHVAECREKHVPQMSAQTVTFTTTVEQADKFAGVDPGFLTYAIGVCLTMVPTSKGIRSSMQSFGHAMSCYGCQCGRVSGHHKEDGTPIKTTVED